MIFEGHAVVLAGALALGPSLTSSFAEAPQDQASAVDSQIQKGSLDDAVSSFDAEANRTGKVDVQQLMRLARAVLASAAVDADERVRTEACMALAAEKEHPCREALARTATASRTSPVVRLRAAAAESTAGLEGRIDAIVAQLGPGDWTAVVDAAPELPPAAAVRVLSQAIAKGAPDVSYSAIRELSELNDPSAIAALRPLAGRSNTPGHLLALAAVAGSGDADALGRLTTVLPELAGREQFAAGIALLRQGDRQGLETLHAVMEGPDELLQLEAAAALARAGDTSGHGQLDAALESSNMWLRLRALELMRGLEGPPRAGVWRQMRDRMAWVRVRAAQVTLASCKRSLGQAAGF